MKKAIRVTAVAVVIAALLVLSLVKGLETRGQYLMNKGIEEFEASNYESAIEFCNRALNFLPKSKKVYLYNQRALIYIYMKEYDMAKADCEEASLISFDNPSTINLTALISLHKGDYEKALEGFSRAIELEERFYMAYVNRAKAYIALRNYEAAFDELAAVLKMDRYNVDALYERAELYVTLDRYSEAYDDYREYITFDPDNIYVLHMLAFISRLDLNYKLALGYIEDILEIKPDFIEVYLERAAVYSSTGEYEKALEDYKLLIDYYSDKAEVYQDRAFFYMAWREYEKGKVDIERALELKPDDILNISLYIDFNFALGKTEEAKRGWLSLKELNLENDDWYYSELAGQSFMWGDYEEALLQIERAIELKSHDPFYLEQKTDILLALNSKDKEQIKALTEKMVMMNPKDDSLQVSKAMTHSIFGEHDIAFAHSKKALRFDGENIYNRLNYYVLTRLADSKEEEQEALKTVEEVLAEDFRYYVGSWNRELASYIIGKIDSKALLKEAGTDLPKLCEANYYIAIKSIGTIPDSQVKRYLQNCLDTGVRGFVEYQMARYLLNNFELISKR